MPPTSPLIYSLTRPLPLLRFTHTSSNTPSHMVWFTPTGLRLLLKFLRRYIRYTNDKNWELESERAAVTAMATPVTPLLPTHNMYPIICTS